MLDFMALWTVYGRRIGMNIPGDDLRCSFRDIFENDLRNSFELKERKFNKLYYILLFSMFQGYFT